MKAVVDVAVIVRQGWVRPDLHDAGRNGWVLPSVLATDRSRNRSVWGGGEATQSLRGRERAPAINVNRRSDRSGKRCV
jgi:hypothetical protein